MANPEHVAILKQGVKVWNEWREENPQVRPALSGADLRRVNLSAANLSSADLNDANLSRANLFNADLGSANLSEADLSEADLTRADLSEADLRGANLSAANLSSADLNDANLSRTNLSGADLFNADLGNANLNEADLSKARLWCANLNWANLSGANLVCSDLISTNLVATNFSGATVGGADLRGASLIGTNFEGADLTDCRVFGISAWKTKLEGATQKNLIITEPGESTLTVDDVEVAQFIYLLLHNEKIRGVIDTVARKAVLILGRFGEHKPVLEAIREELRKRDYLPILFDFKPPETRNVRETVRTLAHLSRFIIADITDPSSIPLELETIVPELRVPVQPLLQRRQREFSMFSDLRETYHWVLATHEYTDISDLLASLGDKVIAPAEQKAKELEKR
jgi:uncharacterized protein YjbI with pentapeptide repeats